IGKISCESCKRKCRGDVLKVAEKYFHKGCFTCSKCKISLEKGGFFMKDDGFYCQEDYQRYFVAKCKICAKDLIGEIVTVMSFSFHRECFKCTGCAIPFHPGDRVTVWQERFFCPDCIAQQKISASSPYRIKQKENGDALLSPLSVTDDEGCISAAEASIGDFTSPQGKPNSRGFDSKTMEYEMKDEFRLPSSDPKCMVSSGVPQKSKSILRKTGTESDKLRASSREHGYLSTDSGLGEKLMDSRGNEDQYNALILPERSAGLRYPSPQSALSPTLSSQQSRQFTHLNGEQYWDEPSPTIESLHSRVPNSDYGRHLSQSYMHLGDPLSQTDRYKRNVSFTSVDKPVKTKHFHIPETKNRYLPPGVRTSELLFGQPIRSTLSTVDASHVRRVIRRPMTQSAMELDQKTADTSVSTSIPPDLPNGVAYPTVNGNTVNGHGLGSVCPGGTTMSPRTGTSTLRPLSGEQEVTAEVRRLACYPAGQQRDQSLPAPIERYDWPGPPASAVILAELMRERRYRRRDHGQVNGGTDDVDDMESQEALSIDCAFDGAVNETSTPRQSSGIGQAILREEMQHKQRSQSQQFLDPISASRSPNAAHEPVFKPRYSTHQFASMTHRSAINVQDSPIRIVPRPPVHSGQPLRPGYTGGRLSSTEKTTSLPASSLLLNSGRTGQTSALWQSRQRLASEHPAVQNGHANISPSNRPCSQSVHVLSQLGTPRSHAGTTNGLTVLTSTDLDAHITTPNGLSPAPMNDSITDFHNLTGNTLSYPSVLLTSKPSSLFHKPNPPRPPKIIPYSELQSFRNKVPKGVDRMALEGYLSEDEFEQVFRLSRTAFYRLPEWKRNDLKRRANLF
ncbi:Actin-binding LIM protein 1, partial [Fasciola gigantica]